MKKANINLTLLKAFLVVSLLSLFHGQIHATGSIVNSTKNIATDNINKVKASTNAVIDELESLRDDLTKAADNAGDIWKDGGDGVNESYDKLKESLQNIKKLDVDGLKNMDLSDLKSTISDLKSKVQGESEIAKSVRSHLDNLESKTAQVLNDAKNAINFAYTAPVGISSDYMKFELSVDTVTYFRDNANGSVSLDAHAYWTLPFTACDDPITLGFKGENIVLMGNGESKLKIDTDKRFVNNHYASYTLSKDKVYLELHDTSYVEIDCNGFKEMYLKGRIRFNSKVLYRADADKDGDSTMYANFAVYLHDLNDVLFEAGFSEPYKIRATEDVIYETKSLVVDFSTSRNAENFQFPKGYQAPFAAGDEAYWTGFAIKTLAVDLSKQFPEFPVKDAAAYNMLIDETGVSGWFQTKIDTENKKNSTIEAKFTDISIGLSGGKVSGGGLNGTVTIRPLSKENQNGGGRDTLKLGLEGKMYSDRNGHLNIDIKTEIKKDMTYQLPIIEKTTLTLGQGTSFQYQHLTDTTDKNETKYKNIFTLVVNGGLDVENKLVNINGLRFEGLKLCSESPHFDAGKFSLNGVDVPSLHGLPFGLKSMGASSRDGKAILEPKIYLTLIGKETSSDSKQGASVEAEFGLVSTIKDEGEHPGWSISGLELNSIAVNIDYSAFHLSGMVKGYRDHNIYGDGFEGKIDLSMKVPNIQAGLQAYFGRTTYDITTGNRTAKEFRYWFVSGYCNMPPGIVLFPPAVYLKSVSLSLYSKVLTDFDSEQFVVRKVTPDVTNKFGFAAGIGFYCAQDNLIDAKVRMGMDFSSSGGVSRLFLNGKVGILGKEGEGFNKSFMVGTVDINYDFEHDIFDMGVLAKTGESISNIIEGKAKLNLHTEPKKWYCNIGTVSAPVNLKFMKKINASTYLMFGHDIPTTLPPLDPRISSLFNVTQSTATTSDHSDMFQLGTGFAFGIALSLDCHLNKFVYADLVFLGGTDLLIVRGSKAFCPDAASKYRAKGQVYVYLAAGAGIKFRKKKYEIVEFSAAADLRGEVPKPVFIEGNIAFKYRILGGMIKGHAHAKYSHGTPCDPGRTDNGVFFDGSELDVEEDQKALDSQGRELEWE